MSEYPLSQPGYGLSREIVDGYARYVTKDPLGDPLMEGPQVCLLYESERERDELSARLREAKLDELPWEYVEVRPTRRPQPRPAAMRRSYWRLSDNLTARSVGARAVFSSHWAIISAVILSPFPFVLMWLLARGLNSPKVAVAS
jgi:hypothetical protein